MVLAGNDGQFERLVRAHRPAGARHRRALRLERASTFATATSFVFCWRLASRAQAARTLARPPDGCRRPGRAGADDRARRFSLAAASGSTSRRRNRRRPDGRVPRAPVCDTGDDPPSAARSRRARGRASCLAQGWRGVIVQRDAPARPRREGGSNGQPPRRRVRSPHGGSRSPLRRRDAAEHGVHLDVRADDLVLRPRPRPSRSCSAPRGGPGGARPSSARSRATSSGSRRARPSISSGLVFPRWREARRQARTGSSLKAPVSAVRVTLASGNVSFPDHIG